MSERLAEVVTRLGLVLANEYRQRIALKGTAHDMEADRREIEASLRRVGAQEDRVTEAYVGEVMDLVRYKAGMTCSASRRSRGCYS